MCNVIYYNCFFGLFLITVLLILWEQLQDSSVKNIQLILFVFLVSLGMRYCIFSHNEDSIVSLLASVILDCVPPVFIAFFIKNFCDEQNFKKRMPIVLVQYHKLCTLLTNVDYIFSEFNIKRDRENDERQPLDDFFCRERLIRQLKAISSEVIKLENSNSDEKQKFLKNKELFVRQWEVIKEIGNSLLGLLDSEYDMDLIKELDFLLNRNRIQVFMQWLKLTSSGEIAYNTYCNDKMEFERSLDNIVRLHRICFKMYELLLSDEKFGKGLNEPKFYREYA